MISNPYTIRSAFLRTKSPKSTRLHARSPKLRDGVHPVGSPARIQTVPYEDFRYVHVNRTRISDTYVIAASKTPPSTPRLPSPARAVPRARVSSYARLPAQAATSLPLGHDSLPRACAISFSLSRCILVSGSKTEVRAPRPVSHQQASAST